MSNTKDLKVNFTLKNVYYFAMNESKCIYNHNNTRK